MMIALWDYDDISIHAPARGATAFIDGDDLTPQEFQSTLLREERHEPEIMKCDDCPFQSTLLREERLAVLQE